ncbi:MAG: alpha/beta fold hydrolase [Saprospiraceae bacterium]
MTQTIHSFIRIYHEISCNPLVFGKDDYINIPVGFASFPKEIPTPPRSYIEKGLNIVHWSNFPDGGHFAALEQPKLLADDIVSFFSKLS